MDSATKIQNSRNYRCSTASRQHALDEGLIASLIQHLRRGQGMVNAGNRPSAEAVVPAILRLVLAILLNAGRRVPDARHKSLLKGHLNKKHPNSVKSTYSIKELQRETAAAARTAEHGELVTL